MGEPKFSRPKYDTPSHPWKADRIEEEHAIRASHGLKNMKEIWKAKSQLRRHRRQAMRLIGNVDTTEGHGKREMEDLLGVGYARIEQVPSLADEQAIAVEVLDTREKYPRCARSWKRRPDVGSDADYPDLSARDAAVVRELGASEYDDG